MYRLEFGLTTTRYNTFRYDVGELIERRLLRRLYYGSRPAL